MSEASATTRRELGGYEITTTGGTVSIFFAGIFTEIEDSRTANTNAHTNYEIVQVAYVIESDSESDEGSNYDIQDSSFVVNDEETTNFYEEEEERNFISKDCKW